MGIVFWGLRMGRGVVSDPQKKFQPDRPSIFLLLDPKVVILTPRVGDFGHLFALGALERGLRAVFWGVFGRFRAFSGGYRVRNHRKYIIMSLEGIGSVLRGSYGCLVSFCGVS